MLTPSSTSVLAVETVSDKLEVKYCKEFRLKMPDNNMCVYQHIIHSCIVLALSRKHSHIRC